MAATPLTNWNRSAESHPTVIKRPSTPREIADIVKDVAGCPSPVRAAGELHSVNACFAADGGTQVLMDGFQKCEVDHTTRQITAGAGVTLIDMRDALRRDDLGLELPVAPEIGNATAGSVACSGTKDSSLFQGPPVNGNEATLGSGFGQVGSAVVAVKMIDAAGNDRTVTDPQELRDVRSSYGLLGIIYEVTCRAQPLVPIHTTYDFIAIDPRRVPTIADLFGPDAQAVLGFLEPFRPGILVERRTLAADREITPVDILKRRIRDWLWEWGASEATTALTSVGHVLDEISLPRAFHTAELASLLSPLLRFVPSVLASLAPAHRDPTDKLLGLFDVVTPDVLKALGGFTGYRSDSNIRFTRNRSTFFDFSFWAYPVHLWPTVMPKFLEFCADFHRDEGFRPALFTEVYFIAADDRSLLSFAPNEHVFTLDIVHNGPDDPLWKKMNEQYNARAAAWGGRPVLNQTKQLHRTPEVVKTALPNWTGFKAKLQTTGAFDRFCAGTMFAHF